MNKTNAWTGNKGEWSEVYTFFRLVADGVIYPKASVAVQLVRLQPMITPCSISVEYALDRNKVLVTNSQKPLSQPLEFTTTTFAAYADIVANVIVERANKKGTFSIPEVVLFLEKLGFNGIKAPSQTKSDIFLSWFDATLGEVITYGFDIKSHVGSSPTALNASCSTNVRYQFTKLVPADRTKDFNQDKRGLKDTLSSLVEEYPIEYVGFESETFKNNLLMIDSSMPNLWAAAIYDFYLYRINRFSEVVDNLAKDNHKNKQVFKDFVFACSQGMTAATPWQGPCEKILGIIVVDKNLSINVLPMNDRNAFAEYLINNITLDSPRRSKYKFGKIYEVNNNEYIRLNAQLRFC